jgi:twitching motility protein PilI
MMTESLRELRDRPFDLLLALEAQTLGESGGLAARGQELWVGVAFRLGSHNLVVSRNDVREVITWPGVTAVPRAKPWLLGVANVRGQLIPVTDLSEWAALGSVKRTRANRVIVINHPDIPAGLLVDEVVGFRRFAHNDSAAGRSVDLPASITPYILGTYAREDEQWTVVGLHELVESEAFLQAAS